MESLHTSEAACLALSVGSAYTLQREGQRFAPYWQRAERLIRRLRQSAPERNYRIDDHDMPFRIERLLDGSYRPGRKPTKGLDAWLDSIPVGGSYVEHYDETMETLAQYQARIKKLKRRSAIHAARHGRQYDWRVAPKPAIGMECRRIL